MVSNKHQLGIEAAVFSGALLLIGIPVMVLLFALIDAITLEFTESIEPVWINEVVLAILSIVVILVGLQLAWEASMMQLHGLSALDRGSRTETVIRKSIGATIGTLIIGSVSWFVLSYVVQNVELYVAIPGLVLTMVALWALYRGLKHSVIVQTILNATLLIVVLFILLATVWFGLVIGLYTEGVIGVVLSVALVVASVLALSRLINKVRRGYIEAVR